MKVLIIALIVLVITPGCFAKTEWHNGQLVLVSAKYSTKYSVAFFTEDGQGGMLWGTGVNQNIAYESQFDCPGCLAAASTFTSMMANCSYGLGSDVCEARIFIPYQLTKCRKCSDQEQEIGIKFASGVFWVVIEVQPAKEVSRMLSQDADSYASVARQMEQENARNTARLAELRRQHSCLLSLKVGSQESEVYDCGTPDHTNSDLNTDQLVYPDDVLVYIDRRTKLVENIQWTH